MTRAAAPTPRPKAGLIRRRWPHQSPAPPSIMAPITGATEVWARAPKTVMAARAATSSLPSRPVRANTVASAPIATPAQMSGITKPTKKAAGLARLSRAMTPA